jgi:serine/threonine protein kinase
LSTTELNAGEALTAEGNAPHDGVWPAPGTVLGGRFVVERRLGAGGMGYVVAARHPELDDLVAIKLIQPDRALGQEARNRLVREARAAAKIRSAHVVRIFDVVSRGAGAPYVVMECLEGETLAQRLDRGPLAVDRAVEIVIQACEAIAEAHRNGAIHRDLKPSNLFLTALPGRACFVKVLDFGIAKIREDGASTLTQSHALLGSPAYASPEQLRASKEVDERADIWSLGVILYECVTGKLPFGGRALAELCGEIMRDPPRPPRAHRAELPERLELAILRCLEKEPDHRFEDVAELVRALEDFAPAAASECLNYIGGLHPKLTARASTSVAPVVSSVHGSTITHASVAHPAEPTSPKRTQLWLLIGAIGAATLWTILSNVRSSNDDLAAAVSANAVGPAAPTHEGQAPPPPPLAAERRGHAADAVAPVAPEPRSRRPPDAKREPQFTRTRPTVHGARASASAPLAASAPPPLEMLPLNELIDGRK